MANSNLRNALSSPAIRYFFEVAQAGSFRQAAENIGIAVSAVHRQVGLLEKQVRTPLLQRSRGREGVRLTAAGEVLVYRIRRAMHEVSVAITEIDGLKEVKRGKIIIGSTDTLAMDLLAPFLVTFRETNPRIDFDVRIAEKAEIIAHYERMQLDLLLLYNAPVQIGLRTLAEFKPLSYAVVSESHPLAERKSTTLAECAQFPLTLVNDAAVQDGIVERMASNTGVKPKIVLTTNSYALMRASVAAGLAISVQAALSGRYRPRYTGLAFIPIRDPMGRFSTLSCCVPATKRLTPAADLFVSRLIHSLPEDLQNDGLQNDEWDGLQEDQDCAEAES
jgi:DNA-binding transcriptional LysR family regulator